MSAPPARPADSVHDYRCSRCREKGHSIRTCGQTPEQRKAKRDGSHQRKQK